MSRKTISLAKKANWEYKNSILIHAKKKEITMNYRYSAIFFSIAILIVSKPPLHAMSLDQKIGQLFMVATVADPENSISKDVLFGRSSKNIPSIKQEADLLELIKKYHIGGVLFLGKSDAEKQLAMTNRLIAFNNRCSSIPLLFALDGEWGPAMRITNATKFPFNIALGAICDKRLIQKFAFMIGSMLKALHIGINFAPVADCNTNYLNPVINRRSFGENPETVAECDNAFIDGLQTAGVAACVKHLPGHGDTDTDTHTGLATINHSSDRLLKTELVPFGRAVDAQVKAMMAGHLLVPAFDKLQPATLSPTIMTDLVRKTLSFNGLLFTDAMDMGAITQLHTPEENVLLALKAGADCIVAPIDVPKAIGAIQEALKTGMINIGEIDKHVRRMLDLKQWLEDQKDVSSESDVGDILNSEEAQDLSKLLFQKSITLIRNGHVLPIAKSEPLSIVAIGSDLVPDFVTCMQQTNPCVIYLLPKTSTADDYEKVAQSLSGTIIITLFGLTYGKSPFGLTSNAQALIERICKQHTKVAMVLFGNPYALSLFSYAPALVEAYEEHPYAQEAAAKIMSGALEPGGILPVTASAEFPASTSLSY